jgi:hypothetical protein
VDITVENCKLIFVPVEDNTNTLNVTYDVTDRCGSDIALAIQLQVPSADLHIVTGQAL